MDFSDSTQSEIFQTKERSPFKIIKVDDSRRIAKIGFKIFKRSFIQGIKLDDENGGKIVDVTWDKSNQPGDWHMADIPKDCAIIGL